MLTVLSYAFIVTMMHISVHVTDGESINLSGKTFADWDLNATQEFTNKGYHTPGWPTK